MVEREHKVQERIMKLLRKKNCYVYKNAQNMNTETGRPDLTACVPTTSKTLYDTFGDIPVGLFVGIEVKRPGRLSGVSDAQEIVGRQIEKAGGIWILVDDEQTVEKLVDKLKGGKNDV